MENIRRPENLLQVGSPSGMSNFDHAVDDGIEDALRKGDSYTLYAGWDFNGQVWFADETFHCEVWCYHSYQETISAETLDDLMDKVSDEYGRD